MARVPSYVAQQKTNGEIARYENGEWHLYRRKSKRVPGEKNPQVIYEKVAIALPSGRFEFKNAAYPQIGDYICYEMGYSYALKLLISPQWKASLREDWEPIFLDIVRQSSPTSYLLKDKAAIELPSHRFVGARQARFWDSLPEGLNERMQPLKQIQASFYPDNHCTISKPTPMQQKLLDDLGIDLKGCVL